MGATASRSTARSVTRGSLATNRLTHGARNRRSPGRCGVSSDRLRPLWDFSDLEASERRLRAAVAAEGDDAGRAEVVTQLARVLGLRGRYTDGHRLLADADALAGDDDVVRARVLLERGRLLRLAGDLAAALPLFEEAFEIALRAGQDFHRCRCRAHGRPCGRHGRLDAA